MSSDRERGRRPSDDDFDKALQMLWIELVNFGQDKCPNVQHNNACGDNDQVALIMDGSGDSELLKHDNPHDKMDNLPNAKMELVRETGNGDDCDIAIVIASLIGYVNPQENDHVDYHTRRKNEMIAKLIGVLRFLNAHFEFCDFFNWKVVEYFNARKRYLKPKPIVKPEKLVCLKRRFEAAMKFLEKLIKSDESAMKILEDCYKKFHGKCEDIYRSITYGDSSTIAETLETLNSSEPNPVIRHILYFELKILNGVRDNIKAMQSELKSNETGSTVDYSKMLDKVRLIQKKMLYYRPNPDIAKSKFIVSRLNVVAKLEHEIKTDLKNFGDHMERLKNGGGQNALTPTTTQRFNRWFYPPNHGNDGTPSH